MKFRLGVIIFCMAQTFCMAANVYVKTDGSGNGTSWDDALPGSRLAAQLETLTNGDSVFLAAGSYLPTSSSLVGDSATFLLQANVALIGGFPASATGLEHSTNYDPQSNPTILTGDHKGDDNNQESDGYYLFLLDDDNANQVVLALATKVENQAMSLRGLIIRGGSAIGSDFTLQGQTILSDNGGGIYNTGTLRLEDCAIEENYAYKNGGGIYNKGNLEIQNSTFFLNYSGYGSGGGIYNEIAAQLTLSNVKFTRQLSGSDGGAIFNSGIMSARGLEVIRSLAYDAGGAIYTESSPYADLNTSGIASITKSYFEADTSSEGDGGAIANYRGNAKIDSSVFRANKGYLGGALVNVYGKMTVDHSRLVGNKSAGGGAICVIGSDDGASSDVLAYDANRVGFLILRSSTLDSNRAITGGALEMARAGSLSSKQHALDFASVAIENSTLAHNYASKSGSAIYSKDDGFWLSLANTTVAGNRLGTYGYDNEAGIDVGDTLYLTNSLVASHHHNDTLKDIIAPLVVGYHSTARLASGSWSGNSVGVWTYAPEDTLFASEVLDSSFHLTPALTDNGGLTPTIALATESAAASNGILAGSFSEADTLRHAYSLDQGATWLDIRTRSLVNSGITVMFMDQRDVKRSAPYAVGAVGTSAPGTKLKFTVSTTASMGGAVSGGGIYIASRIVKLEATPKEKYRFVSWLDLNKKIISTSPILSFPARSDTVLLAQFVKQNPHWMFVKTNGNGDGSSWDEALPGDSLADRMQWASDGDSVFIAEGTYTPFSKRYTGRDRTFHIQSNIAMFGGYPADAQGMDLTGKDVTKYRTVLTGLLEDNTQAYHVVVANATQIPGQHIELRGLVIENGLANGNDGNAVLFPIVNMNASSTTSCNCLPGSGTKIADRGYGGGIFAMSPMKLDSLQIQENTALYKGGGIYATDSLRISASHFSNDSSGYGGAIYSLAPLLLDSCKLQNNRAPGGGGAVASEGSLKVRKGSFSNNTSQSGYGGALYGATDKAIITTQYSTFASNAGVWGGAIASKGALQINYGAFGNNKSKEAGGAIYSLGEAAIVHGDFYTNRTDKLGGAVFAGAKLSVDSSLFYGDSALVSGGALYGEDESRITRSTFTSNRASDRGGAIHSKGGLILDSVVADSNTSGNVGGAIQSTAITHILNSRLAHNKSQTVGGAIYQASGSLVVENARIVDNTSSYGGGGVYSNGGHTQILRTEFSNNQASQTIGGGLYTKGTLDCFFSTFANNRAIYYGGAIFSEGYTRILSSTLTGNNVDKSIGTTAAISFNQGFIHNSILAHNSGSPSSTDVSSGIKASHNLVADEEQKIFAQYIVDVNGASIPLLADHGGATWTVALADSSVARATGIRLGSFERNDSLLFAYYEGTNWISLTDSGIVAADLIAEFTQDQRGIALGTTPSIGAFHLGPWPEPEVEEPSEEPNEEPIIAQTQTFKQIHLRQDAGWLELNHPGYNMQRMEIWSTSGLLLVSQPSGSNGTTRCNLMGMRPGAYILRAYGHALVFSKGFAIQ